jgi:hypothetical protein
VNQSQPETYAYPLYLAGGLTFIVLLFAISKRQQYSPQNT